MRGDIDQTCLHLFYQMLESKGEELEKLEYNEEIQKLLEEIGEIQVKILNIINYH